MSRNGKIIFGVSVVFVLMAALFIALADISVAVDLPPSAETMDAPTLTINTMILAIMGWIGMAIIITLPTALVALLTWATLRVLDARRRKAPPN